MYHKLTFFNLGNADSCRLDLANGQKFLFDYAAMRDPENPQDRRIDLPAVLRDDLGQRTYYDVVAFTHADDDHIHGATEFFRLEHDKKYQDRDRITMREMWVPAGIIIELTKNLKPEAQTLQAEARYRLREGFGIRVFSRPARLAGWLAQHNLTLADRAHLITDAGQTVPNYKLDIDGVEFFIHSPFAKRHDGMLFDRNECALVFQATFLVGGQLTRLIMSADAPYDVLSDLVDVTRYHKNDDRLLWDIFKLPHHCSYKSLNSEKGTTETTPVPNIKWLFEEQGQQRGVIISTSDPIPTEDTTQPPHFQAANYYRRIERGYDYEFKVTMEHPTVNQPEPLVIIIDEGGARVEKRSHTSSVLITSRQAPRAG